MRRVVEHHRNWRRDRGHAVEEGETLVGGEWQPVGQHHLDRTGRMLSGPPDAIQAGGRSGGGGAEGRSAAAQACASSSLMWSNSSSLSVKNSPAVPCAYTPCTPLVTTV